MNGECKNVEHVVMCATTCFSQHARVDTINHERVGLHARLNLRVYVYVAGKLLIILLAAS